MSAPAETPDAMEVDRSRLKDLLEREEKRFSDEHSRSRELFERARRSLLGGVPMNWMARWAGRFPLFVENASGAHFTDVDGRRYLDLCLGDTGAMTGHAPAATVEAVIDRARRGFTFMLPTEDAIFVGEELARRFGLPFWQTALTATDANRFAIRLARHVTRRPLILVFNWCYHGTVDETFITEKSGVRSEFLGFFAFGESAPTAQTPKIRDLTPFRRPGPAAGSSKPRAHRGSGCPGS